MTLARHVEERRTAANVRAMGTGAAGLRAAIELAEEARRRHRARAHPRPIALGLRADRLLE